jgi:hypothetical protein
MTNGHAGAPMATVTRADQQDFHTDGDDGLSRWMKSNANHPVPKWAFEAMYDALKDALAQRDSALRILKNDVLALEARQNGTDDALARHAKTLGSKSSVSGVKWAGVFESGSTYHEGELVTKSGLWLCKATTTAAPGTDPDAWVLVCRRTKTKDDAE